MLMKKFRPMTPGTRQLILPTHVDLTRVEGRRVTVKPHKQLLAPKRRTGGRNNLGRITCRHRGGGHKKQIRLVDFKRDKLNVPARVASIEYDPNRSAYVALLHYVDGEKRYILAPAGLLVGAMVSTSDQPPFDVGCCMQMKAMPLGSTIHNIELQPGRGGKLVRSAGLSAQLMARSGGYATIKLPSGEMRLINENCRATFGAVSNHSHNLRVESKAGRRRWMGIRPTVRGAAMNPVDHPHGGGEGRTRGNIPQTPWAQFTKGMRTRRKENKYLVKDRRKK
ncbi:MAG: 50S ribosomal protein L2 [Chlamydiales bacterium]|nr:50S ribosomal protein L2 [Chlamydiales bacterium]